MTDFKPDKQADKKAIHKPAGEDAGQSARDFSGKSVDRKASDKALHEASQLVKPIDDTRTKADKVCVKELLTAAGRIWGEENFAKNSISVGKGFAIDEHGQKHYIDPKTALALYCAGPFMYGNHGDKWAQQFGKFVFDAFAPTIDWTKRTLRPGVPDYIANAPPDPEAEAHLKEAQVPLADAVKVIANAVFTPEGANWLGRESRLFGYAPISGAIREAADQLTHHRTDLTLETSGDVLVGGGIGFVSKLHPLAALGVGVVAAGAVANDLLFDPKTHELYGKMWRIAASQDQMTPAQSARAFKLFEKEIGAKADHAILAALAGGAGAKAGEAIELSQLRNIGPHTSELALNVAQGTKNFAADVASGARNLATYFQPPGRVLAPVVGDLSSIYRPLPPKQELNFMHAMSKWTNELDKKKPIKAAVQIKASEQLKQISQPTLGKEDAATAKKNETAEKLAQEKELERTAERKALIERGSEKFKQVDPELRRINTHVEARLLNPHNAAKADETPETIATKFQQLLKQQEHTREMNSNMSVAGTDRTFADAKWLSKNPPMIKGGSSAPGEYFCSKDGTGSILEDYQSEGFMRLTGADGKTHLKANEQMWTADSSAVKNKDVVSAFKSNDGNQVLEFRQDGTAFKYQLNGSHKDPLASYGADGRWSSWDVHNGASEHHIQLPKELRYLPSEKARLAAEFDDLLAKQKAMRDRVEAMRQAYRDNPETKAVAEKKLPQDKPHDPHYHADYACPDGTIVAETRYGDNRRLIQSPEGQMLIGGDNDPLYYVRTKFPDDSCLETYPDDHFMRLTDADGKMHVNVDENKWTHKGAADAKDYTNSKIGEVVTYVSNPAKVVRSTDVTYELKVHHGGPLDGVVEKVLQKGKGHTSEYGLNGMWKRAIDTDPIPRGKKLPDQVLPGDYDEKALWTDERPAKKLSGDATFPFKSLEDMFKQMKWELKRNGDETELIGPAGQSYRYDSQTFEPVNRTALKLNNENIGLPERVTFEFPDGKTVYQGDGYLRLLEPGTDAHSPGVNKLYFENGDHYVIDEKLHVTSGTYRNDGNNPAQSMVRSYEIQHDFADPKLPIKTIGINFESGNECAKIMVDVPSGNVKLFKTENDPAPKEMLRDQLPQTLKDLIDTAHIEQLERPHFPKVREFLKASGRLAEDMEPKVYEVKGLDQTLSGISKVMKVSSEMTIEIDPERTNGIRQIVVKDNDPVILLTHMGGEKENYNLSKGDYRRLTEFISAAKQIIHDNE